MADATDGNQRARVWQRLLILLLIWIAAAYAALQQQPRPDVSQRNYDLNPLHRDFWRHSVTSWDFWQYPIERNPAARLPSISAQLYDVHFATPDRGWAVGDGGVIVSTQDGGASWKPQASGTTQNLLSVHFATPDRGWAVGDEGVIVSTQDGGASWKPQTSETSQTLLSVHFATPDRGWAVGGDLGGGGVIVSTQDGGASWKPQASGTRQRLLSVHFATPDRGWAVGGDPGRGVIVSTQDGGASWKPQTSGTSQTLYSVHFATPDRGWAVGLGGVIVSTQDGGASWKPQASGTPQTLTSVHFATPDRGWAVGDGGVIVSTQDGGAVWMFQLRATPSMLVAPWFMAATVLAIGLALWMTVAVLQISNLDRIGTSDRPRGGFNDDRLVAAPLVLALSRMLRNIGTRPPLVLAIDGEWGSGKSTVMRMLQTDLHAHGARSVWFNAWHHESEKDLLAALLDSIRRDVVPSILQKPCVKVGYLFRLSRLRGARHPAKTFALLLLFVVIFTLLADLAVAMMFSKEGAIQESWLATSMRDFHDAFVKKSSSPGDNDGEPASYIGWFGFITLVSTLGAVLTFLGALLKPFPNPAQLLARASWLRGAAEARQTSYLYRFADDFRDVTTALAPARLYVFIDDLDRCSSDTTKAILEAVNFLTESGDVMIVLGIARERVEKNVAIAYRALGEELAAGKPAVEPWQARQQFAQDFLKKLINLRVTIPPADSRAAAAMLADSALLSGSQRWLPVPGWRTMADRALIWIVRSVAAVLLLLAGWLMFQLTQQPQGAAVAGSTDKSPQATTSNVGVSVANAAKEADGQAVKPVITAPSTTGGLTVVEQPPEHEVPTLMLPLILLAGLLMGARVMQLRSRASSLVTQDTRSLKLARQAWAPVIQTTLQSPREIRRFQNRLRGLVGIMQADQVVPAIGDRAGPKTLAWYRDVLAQQEQRRLLATSVKQSAAPSRRGLKTRGVTWSDHWRRVEAMPLVLFVATEFRESVPRADMVRRWLLEDMKCARRELPRCLPQPVARFGLRLLQRHLRWRRRFFGVRVRWNEVEPTQDAIPDALMVAVLAMLEITGTTNRLATALTKVLDHPEFEAALDILRSTSGQKASADAQVTLVAVVKSALSRNDPLLLHDLDSIAPHLLDAIVNHQVHFANNAELSLRQLCVSADPERDAYRQSWARVQQASERYFGKRRGRLVAAAGA